MECHFYTCQDAINSIPRSLCKKLQVPPKSHREANTSKQTAERRQGERKSFTHQKGGLQSLDFRAFGNFPSRSSITQNAVTDGQTLGFEVKCSQVVHVGVQPGETLRVSLVIFRGSGARRENINFVHSEKSCTQTDILCCCDI